MEINSKDKEIGERLKLVRKTLGFNQEEFGRKLAGVDETGKPNNPIDKSTISKYEQGKDPLSAKAKVELFSTLGISRTWFETGVGDMRSQQEADDVPLSPELQVKEGRNKEVKLLGKHVPLRLKPEEYAEAFGDWPGLPMYNAPVTASFVDTYRDESVYKPYYYLHDPRFRDCDFGAIITGDSMHSEIRHGDFIACKEVKDTRFIVYGDIYYVVATNGLETCKYVNVDPEDKNNLLLVARSEKISPSPLPKDMIHKLYKVRGIVRGY